MKQKYSDDEILKGMERRAEEHRQLLKGLQEAVSPRWIPVSERLPKEPKNPIDEEEGAYDLPNLTEYNVTIADAQEATTLYYAGDDVWIDNCGNYYHVIAWMPLPEPYKPPVMQETRERAGEYADAPTLRPAT